MTDHLHNRIFDILKMDFPLDRRDEVHKIVENIIKSYNESHRKYHTMNHIVKCLDILSELTLDEFQLRNISIAIIYHDVVYDTMNPPSMNEQLSSMRYCDEMLNVYSRTGMCIRNMIMSTTHNGFFTDEYRTYQEYICDIDLHQLGCGLNEFLYNENLIREEYKDVPDEIFYPARYKILRQILYKDIYYSNKFKTRFGANARRNIMYVINRQNIFSAE